MQKAIIGKKVGMTQIFDEAGHIIPVTVIEAGPCTVVQKKTVESDGYQAVQLGFGEVSAKKVKMTDMPQLVSVFNTVGGGAAALVALNDILTSEGTPSIVVLITA